MKWLGRLASTSAPGAVVLIRLLVGGVFLSEGVQKFLVPGELGTGRFAEIGFPSPGFLAYFVGAFEVVCGALLLLGLFTRLAAIPMLANMAVAFASTKVPILLESGFWEMAHEARNDYAQFLGSLFLLIVGAGPWSLDAAIVRGADRRDGEGHV